MDEPHVEDPFDGKFLFLTSRPANRNEGVARWFDIDDKKSDYTDREIIGLHPGETGQCGFLTV